MNVTNCDVVFSLFFLPGTEKQAVNDLAQPCGDSRGESVACELPSGDSVS